MADSVGNISRRTSLPDGRKASDERAAAINVFAQVGEFILEDGSTACKWTAQGIISSLWGQIPMSWCNVATGLHTQYFSRQIYQ